MKKQVIRKQAKKGMLTRAKAPTPKFFKAMRTIGLVFAAIGATIMAAPIALPATVITLGGYLVVAGGVASAVSQLTIEDDKEVPKIEGK